MNAPPTRAQGFKEDLFFIVGVFGFSGLQPAPNSGRFKAAVFSCFMGKKPATARAKLAVATVKSLEGVLRDHAVGVLDQQSASGSLHSCVVSAPLAPHHQQRHASLERGRLTSLSRFVERCPLFCHLHGTVRSSVALRPSRLLFPAKSVIVIRVCVFGRKERQLSRYASHKDQLPRHVHFVKGTTKIVPEGLSERGENPLVTRSSFQAHWVSVPSRPLSPGAAKIRLLKRDVSRFLHLVCGCGTWTRGPGNHVCCQLYSSFCFFSRPLRHVRYESKAVLASKVTELLPVEVVAKLEASEIFTMSDLSFSAAALPGQCTEEKFLESVSKPIFGANAPLGRVARLMKLHWQSCAIATSSLVATSTVSQHREGPIDVPPEELAEPRSRIEAKYLRRSSSGAEGKRLVHGLQVCELSRRTGSRQRQGRERVHERKAQGSGGI